MRRGKEIDALERGPGASIESDPITGFSTTAFRFAATRNLLRSACFPQ
jgi:hypothetical protein